ncbi:MAG: hypothetical protein RR919_06095 [Bacteroidales bacterium]
MKKIFTFSLIAGLSVLLFACGSSKKLAKSDGMQELNIPLNGAEYRTNEKCYRAVQSGISPNSAMAKKIAVQNARQELAASIKADLEAVIENYGKGQGVDTTNEYKGQYQELVYTTLDQQLVGVKIIDEKLFKQADNSYKYYVCLQINKDELKEKITQKLSKEEKMKLEFDLDKFRRIYDEQMKAFSNK